MKLSARLQQVLNFLLEEKVLADIGCDHALLPIAYISKNPNGKVYAMDNKQEPLNQAIKNINLNLMTNKIIPLLSDGLEYLPDDVNQICIAGMGGNNIIEILSSHPDKCLKVDRFVFQPNNGCEELRRYLTENDFLIEDEVLVEENDIIYEVLQVKRGHQILSNKECIFGPELLKIKGELFIKKWQSQLNYLKNIYDRIPNQYATKKDVLKKDIELIESVIN